MRQFHFVILESTLIYTDLAISLQGAYSASSNNCLTYGPKMAQLYLFTNYKWRIDCSQNPIYDRNNDLSFELQSAASTDCMTFWHIDTPYLCSCRSSFFLYPLGMGPQGEEKSS